MAKTEEEKAAEKAAKAAAKAAAADSAEAAEKEELERKANEAAQAAYDAVLAGHKVDVEAQANLPKPTVISQGEWDRRIKLGTEHPEYINSSLGHFVVE